MTTQVTHVSNTTFDYGNSLSPVSGENGRITETLERYLLNNALINPKDYGATGDGVTNDTAAIDLAIAAASAQSTSLYFPPGTYVMQSNRTIAPGMVFAQGAMIAPSAAAVITIQGPIYAGLYQIFAGTGTILLGVGSVSEVWACWFGGFITGSTAAANMSSLTKAKAALADSGFSAGYFRTDPIRMPSGTFDIDNATPFAMAINITVRGTTTKQQGRGTILRPTVANPVFDWNGDFIFGWEVSGVTIDYANVASAQTNAACVAFRMRNGASQGASNGVLGPAFVMGAYRGLEDTSPVSFGYTVQFLEVDNPGDAGIVISGSGTSKRIVRPLIGGNFVGGNNRGIVITNQTNEVTIIDPIIESLHGEFLLFTNSTVNVINGYDECVPSVNSTGDHLVFDGGITNLTGYTTNGLQLTTTGSACIRIKNGAQVKLDSYLQKGQGVIGVGTAVTGLLIETPTSATQVIIVNSPSIRTKMQENSGSCMVIADPTGVVRVLEPAKKITTAVATSGAGEQVLQSYTLPLSTVNSGGAIRYVASGTITGGAGTKTLSFHFGSSFIVAYSATATTANWKFEVVITGDGTQTGQLATYTAWNGTAIAAQGFTTLAQAANNTISMSMHGNCANAADVITQRYTLVETL